MFMGFALVQQTMGFRFQDALGLSAPETARVLGLAMMLSAGASLFAQGVVVQRFKLAPFDLLRLAIPLLIISFTIMALFQTQLMLTLAMGLQGFAMGMAGPAFMAGASLAVSSEEQGSVAVLHRVAAHLVSRWAPFLAACCIKSTRFCPMPLPRLSILF